MGKRKRNEGGRFVATVTPERVLEVFQHVPGPVITSSDVADHLNCTTEAARQKLNQLEANGTLASRTTGRTKIYWRTENEPEPDWKAGFGVLAGTDIKEKVEETRREMNEDFEDHQDAVLGQ